MKIRIATCADSETVFRIREQSIKSAYPKYYPRGAVAWFLSPDNSGYIADDAEYGKVYVLETDAGIVGTVTIDGNELKRLFVLPEMQGRGYGSALVSFAEERIFAGFDRVLVDVALSSRKFYEKLGYSFVSAEEFASERGDVICWHIMQKRKRAEKSRQFRAMRRRGQAMTKAECEEILRGATSGVLAVCGDDCYPYAVPLSFVYDDGTVYFHSAVIGHKTDAIKRDEKASFCVIAQDEVLPKAYTTAYKSVIIFGRARIISDADEKRKSIEKLAAKYSPNDERGRAAEIDRFYDKFVMIGLSVEHMSGKKGKELMNQN